MGWNIGGKTVLVTGATSGIGLEASVALARQGARVVMVGRDRAKTELAAVAVTARAGGLRAGRCEPRAGRDRCSGIGAPFPALAYQAHVHS